MSDGALRGSDVRKWRDALAAQARHWQVLEAEYLQKDARPRWNMLLFRRKRAALAQFASRVVRLASGPKRDRPVIIGYGAAKFSPTSGKVVVPTNEVYRTFKRVFKMLSVKGAVIPIDEFRTTRCCHRCGCDMEKVMVQCGEKMVENRRVRLCAACGTEDSPRRRNRDRNAAMNILQVLESFLRGEDRPMYLRRVRQGGQVVREISSCT
jgi:hypothetical protein